MKVAIVTHNVVRGDGQGRVNYELARYLRSQGVEVTLIADKVTPELPEVGAEWLPVHPNSDGIDLVKVFRFRASADKVIERHRHRFDVIMACGAVTTVAHDLNAVHFVHGTWRKSPYHSSKVNRGPNGWYQWVFSSLNERWEKEAFRNARLVAAVSDMVRDELIEIGVPRDRVRVIFNGVDLDEYRPGSFNRKKLGLPEGVPLGLFAGDIRSPIKNLDTVLKGLVEAPDTHFAVAGRVAQSPYPALAEELGISDRVHFLDFRTDLPEIMRACDFFTLVSRRDSCPLVMLEALASGLPVITAPTVGTSSLISADNGFVLSGPNDVEALAAHFRTLSRDAGLREKMSRGARRLAERHSWDVMARGYLDLFDQLAASPRNRAEGSSSASKTEVARA